MQTQALQIQNGDHAVPAVLWGKAKSGVFLAVHGLMSNKRDTVIQLAARAAAEKGFATLSFDLPEHGDRAGETGYACNPWNGCADLMAVYRYARTLTNHVCVFACSLGAYFTLLRWQDIQPQQTLLLSPVVRMDHLIADMMASAGVSLEQLERERHIPVPGSQPLDWDYYCYVRDHPIQAEACGQVRILMGEQDALCRRDDEEAFVSRCQGKLTVVPGAEHFFYKPEQLEALYRWLEAMLNG